MAGSHRFVDQMRPRGRGPLRGRGQAVGRRGARGWSAQKPRAAFFAFLAWRFSFRLADAAFLFFLPPLSFDAIRGLLTDCGQPGRAAPIAYRHFADDERRIAVGMARPATVIQALTRPTPAKLAEGRSELAGFGGPDALA